MNAERTALIQRYIVLHLKEMEVLHLILLSFHLSDTRVAPNNVMGHEVDSFKETLLGAIVIAFMAISDKPKSTSVRDIWRQLHPRCARAIDRIWEKHISPGEAVMKTYRNQAGAHGDEIDKYLSGKLGLFTKSEVVLKALKAFYGLSICLAKRQAKDAPDLVSEIEAALLDAELRIPDRAFSRKWLRNVHLLQSGHYNKVFR